MNEKHKLMKPKDPARSGRQASRRAKKWQSRLSAALLCTLLFTVFFPSCKDEDLLPSAGMKADITRADGTLNDGGAGLVRNSDGTWTATRRVPLVGAGRVVNSLSDALVEVGAYEDDDKGVLNLVDIDIENVFSPTSFVGVEALLNQIVSVRDLNHTYAGGQKVGFALRATKDNVLSLDLLTALWIDTYKNGVRNETTGDHLTTFGEESNLLDLGVGNITDGNTTSVYVIEGICEKDFDEIRLGTAGIAAGVADNFEILYAYVGENPIIPAINVDEDNQNTYKLSYEYFENQVTTPGSILEGNQFYGPNERAAFIDDNLTNGPGFDGVIVGNMQPYITVDFGKTIPAGTEIGFYVTTGKALGLTLGNDVEVTTYDNSDNVVDTYHKAEIIGLTVVGGGAYYFNLITKGNCRKATLHFWGINVEFGVTQIQYAYVREPTEVDVSSYINLTDAVVYTPNYRFADPEKEGIEVTYEVTSWPSELGDKQPIITTIQNETSGKKNLLTGMNAIGDYEITATYEINGKQMTTTAIIRREAKPEDYCNIPLINDGSNGEWEAYVDDSWEIDIFNLGHQGDLQNVVNDRTDDYIEAEKSAISLISNRSLIGIKAKGDQSIKPKQNGGIVRTGFIISREENFLKLDVLKFLRIKLFNDGVEVTNSLAFDNNGVSLGLVGNVGSESLARLSIDTDKEFDEMQLWYTGLAGVDIANSLKIYYAFYDEAEEDCANPGEECMQLITNANYGAVAVIKTEGAVTVASSAVNLSYIVDNDAETCADWGVGATVGVGTTIEVTFDEIPKNQEVGFIIGGLTAAASVNLINVIQIHAYNGETPVQGDDATSSGGLLNVKLLGGGDKSYISVIPNGAFDRLDLVFGEGVSALGINRIYGVYLRPDYDGDGVIDCVDDGLLTDITGLTVTSKHFCKEDPAPEFNVIGGVEGKVYTLEFVDNEHSNKIITTQAKLEGKKFVFDENFFTTTLTPGYYSITVKQDVDYNALPLAVHPAETTWLGHNENWNDWSNWSNGVPWDCTDVYIPTRDVKGGNEVIGIPSDFTGISKYPDLKEIRYGNKYSAEYYCDNIYFAPGAELVGQHNLHYSGKVFIDTELKSGYYNLMSAPLQDMVTGDMFIAKKASDWEGWRDDAFGNYFKPIDATTDGSYTAYEEQRTNPFIYQRFWSSGDDKVWNETLSRSSTRDDYDNTEDEAIECDLLTTDWSRTFNSVESAYEKGQGFAVRAGDEGVTNSNYTFHFPKSHTSYHYYNNLGTELKGSGTISRTNAGKLWIDGNTTNPDLSVTLTRESSGNLFLFGNPMMSHIDIQQFLAKNANVSSVLVYDKSQKEYVTISNGASTSSITQIAPMEAVFLQTGSSAQSLAVELSDAMLVQGNSVSRTAAAPNQLRLTATSRGHSASCVVVPSSAASDDYDAREDATLLVGSEEGSGVAVYTVAGGKALSIQRMNQSGRIPVGFYLKEEGNVTLSFDPQGDAWQGWNLVDQQTGKRYPLDSETNLGTVKSGAGRFYLERTGN